MIRNIVNIGDLHECRLCSKSKPSSEFLSPSRYMRKDGTETVYFYSCKPCWAKQSRERRDKDRPAYNAYIRERRSKDRERYSKQSRARAHGLTVSQLDEMYLNQRGRCAICDDAFLLRRLHIDHDHKTGKVRGLLCQECNHGIGNLRDSQVLLASAARYLEANS